MMSARQIFNKMSAAGIDTEYLSIGRDEVVVEAAEADLADKVHAALGGSQEFNRTACAGGVWLFQKRCRGQ